MIFYTGTLQKYVGIRILSFDLINMIPPPTSVTIAAAVRHLLPLYHREVYIIAESGENGRDDDRNAGGQRRRTVVRSEGGGGGGNAWGCDNNSASNCNRDSNSQPQHFFKHGNPHWDGRWVGRLCMPLDCKNNNEAVVDPEDDDTPLRGHPIGGDHGDSL